ncbi:MAG: plasmid pRiA4b ORF-3 family protein [Schleiferiaceae bacterium]|nr:plasmid pRiA4b ORF-3 family protein [Schleiferiaceae bacterium]MDP4859121.1 plasmid pRiA4b ORF-3 family protein [Schleiferiaceae bacterium]
METTHALLIRVTLKDVEPTVWRTLNVPNSKDLLSLAVASFLSLGWDADAPFHYVLPTGGKVVDPTQWATLSTIEQIDKAPANATEQNLWLYFEGGPLTLVYETEIPWTLELTMDAHATECDADEPIFVAYGAMAGPPQWCGGKEGYRFLCETIADPESPSYSDVVERLYVPFNPTFFSVAFANDRIGVNAKECEDYYCTGDDDE